MSRIWFARRAIVVVLVGMTLAYFSAERAGLLAEDQSAPAAPPAAEPAPPAKDAKQADPKKPSGEIVPDEAPQAGKPVAPPAAVEKSHEGVTIENFYPGTIIACADGTLLTELGMRSSDKGRTWAKDPKFAAPVKIGNMGILRLPNGELGLFEDRDDDMPQALGNSNNNWYFYFSKDEGATWSEPVQITLNGLTLGLQGTMFTLKDGKRICVTTYSQFLGSRFDKRGASWGTLNGVRTKTETEAHYPQHEVSRFYYSDDNGRTWKPNDGWIMGWRDDRFTDDITEPDAVELKNGNILLVARGMLGRVHTVTSDDRGESWWPGAKPIDLASSYSPIRIRRLPKTGDLVLIWNQVSREEIKKGLRRARLTSAVSKDEGKTWGHFRNIEAIKSMAGVTHVKPDDELTPIWGDDEVGVLPPDYTNYHYPTVSVIGDEVFVSYVVGTGHRTRILPVEWFYEGGE